MARIVVIGAGAMGLAAAYRAATLGHQVDVVEAAPEPGGMAGHFDFDGLSVERFYHFICKADHPTFALLSELGLADQLLWRSTTMGLFTDGKLHPWVDPISLLRFPSLSLVEKLRYGLFSFLCIRRNRWPALENKLAHEWIIQWCGQSVYDRFWKPLLHYKYFEYAGSISAAWIWTRIRRVGRSRRNLMQEELGHLRGGSITLINALIRAIESRGGRIHLANPAEQVTVEGNRVTGVQTTRGHFPADAVISTAPIANIGNLVPDLPAACQEEYAAIHNIGVICVIYKLKRSLTPHFWVNIAEPGIHIPGIIEFSNLRQFDNCSVLYVPYYMPTTNAKFSWSDEDLLQESFACLVRINPALTRADILATRVARLRHGQPVCGPGFAAKIPQVQTPILGLQIADTCFYYPEDRGIAESVRMGQAMAMALGQA